MKVILKQDIKSLGYKDDVVTVKAGYANNFLIPQGMASIASESNLKMLAEDIKQAKFKQEKIKLDAEKIAGDLNDKSFTIATKAGTSGKIFGAITPLQLAQSIKTQTGHDVDRRRIVFDQEVKMLGSYTATINLHKEVPVKVNVEVVQE